jgi:hypothetical protein
MLEAMLAGVDGALGRPFPRCFPQKAESWRLAWGPQVDLPAAVLPAGSTAAGMRGVRHRTLYVA